jgi:hypothetical protein
VQEATYSSLASDLVGAGHARWWAERWIGVVVDTSGSELAALAPNVDSDAGFRRQLRFAPPHEVILQGTGALVIGESAVLERDPALVREQRLVELAETLRTSVDVVAAGRFARVPVGLSRGKNRVDVAGGESTLVLAHDVWLAQLSSGCSRGGRFACRP